MTKNTIAIGRSVYEAHSHYYRFDDDICNTLFTSKTEACHVAREMAAERDPVHTDRSDMGWSVLVGVVTAIGEDGPEIDWVKKVAGGGYQGK